MKLRMLARPLRPPPDATDGAGLQPDDWRLFNESLVRIKVSLRSGIRLGATTIGGSNNFAVNNLISGNHTLRIVCIIAPDKVGTLGVSLSQGLTFSGGGTDRSANLTEGGSVTYNHRAMTAIHWS